MNEELKQTMKIVRRPKVKTDERGHTVWDETVETVNLELVSTQMLAQIIDANDDGTQTQLREMAQGANGVLAHDIDKGRFEIISDEELQAILDGTDLECSTAPSSVPVDDVMGNEAIDGSELDLVSTQLLRTILDPVGEAETDESSFNPYDRG